MRCCSCKFTLVVDSNLLSPPANQFSAPLFSSSSSSSSSCGGLLSPPPAPLPKLEIVPNRPPPLGALLTDNDQLLKCVQNTWETVHLAGDEPDQSPTLPTLGAAAGRAQLEGNGSAASPPSVRPVESLLSAIPMSSKYKIFSNES